MATLQSSRSCIGKYVPGSAVIVLVISCGVSCTDTEPTVSTGSGFGGSGVGGNNSAGAAGTPVSNSAAENGGSSADPGGEGGSSANTTGTAGTAAWAGGSSGSDAGTAVNAGTAGTSTNIAFAGAGGTLEQSSSLTGGVAGTIALAGSTVFGGSTAMAGNAGAGTMDVPNCLPPQAVSTAEDVVAAVAALGTTWSIVPAYLSKADAITSDLLPTVDMTVPASAITPPTNHNCWGAGGCDSGAKFLSPGDSVFTGSNALQLTAGTAVRLRPYILDLHPHSNPPSIAVVTVMPPCTQPCPEGQRRCSSDQVCYAAGEAFCLRCEKRPAERCACEEPRQDVVVSSAPDSCDYFTSADTVYIGKCQDGVCKM